MGAMEIGLAISFGLLLVFYIFELGSELANYKHRFGLSLVMLVCSGAAIHFPGIESFDSVFSVFIVSSFIVGGVCFVYTATTWLMRRSH